MCLWLTHACLNTMTDLLLSYFMLGSGIVNKITTTTVEHCGVSVSKQYIICGNELLGFTLATKVSHPSTQAVGACAHSGCLI